MKSPTKLPEFSLDKTGWPWGNGIPDFPDTTTSGTLWPKISIVTPSFNTDEYLEATIRSVLLQGYPNLEYIVIDGGSRDSSKKIIEKYSNHIFYWVSEKDNGQYDAINKGFSVSTGEIMLWINSDDMLVPNSLKLIGEIFSQFKQVQWLTGYSSFWDEDGNLYKIFTPVRFNKRLLQLGCYESRAINWIMQECTVWTRSLWDQSGGKVDEHLDYAGDFDLWCRFSKFENLYRVSTLIGANRQRQGQKSESPNYKQEVDKVLSRSFNSYLVNKLLRLNIIRKIVRSYFILTHEKKHYIYYDARNMKWLIRDELL